MVDAAIERLRGIGAQTWQRHFDDTLTSLNDHMVQTYIMLRGLPWPDKLASPNVRSATVLGAGALLHATTPTEK